MQHRLILTLALLLAAPGEAAAEWKLTQLTDCRGRASEDPDISGDGQTVVFVSTCDLLEEQNRDHNREIFRWREGRGLEQLTHTERCDNAQPSLDESGGRAVFYSSCRFDEGNPDRSPEIYLVEAPDAVRRVTDLVGGSIAALELSPSGQWAAFLSNADPAGTNPDLSLEAFLLELDRPEAQPEQLTNEDGSYCREIAIGNQAAAFSCNHRRAGKNPEGGLEILAGWAGGGVVEATEFNGCECRDPALNDLGNLVLFRSDCDPQAKNLNRRYELMLARGVEGVEQITENTNEGVFQPDLSGDGKRAAYVSRWGADGLNPDHNSEVYVIALDGDRSPQPVYETRRGGSHRPRLSRDGRKVVYCANSDPLDNNSDGSLEIFLAEDTAPAGPAGGEKESEGDP